MLDAYRAHIAEYAQQNIPANKLNPMSVEIYQYLNFDLITSYPKNAEERSRIASIPIDKVKFKL